MNSYNSVNDLVTDVEKLISKLGKSVGPDVVEIKSKLQDSIDELRQQARAGVKAGVKAGRSSFDDLTAALTKRPHRRSWGLLAVGAVVAVGLVSLIAANMGDEV